jgi:hypothetical protein
MTTNTLWTTVKDDLRERREAKAQARTLREELAAYSTPSQVEDLLAALEHQEAEAPVADAATVRSILHENLRAYYAAHGPRRYVAGL